MLPTRKHLLVFEISTDARCAEWASSFLESNVYRKGVLSILELLLTPAHFPFIMRRFRLRKRLHEKYA